MSSRAGNRRGPSNLELAVMLGNLNPKSATRPCTQCSREVPKTQVLLTCEQCREKKKRQKARRKERDMAVEEGRGAGPNQGLSSVPLQAVIAKQEQETATRRAATRKSKDGGSKANSEATSSATSSGLRMGMGIVLQAMLHEHERARSFSKPVPKKKTTKKATAARDDDPQGLDFLTSLLLFEMATATTKGSSSSSGTTRKRKREEVESNEPGTIYDAETARKRLRGDMAMPKLEPILQASSSSNPAGTKGKKPAAASSAQSYKTATAVNNSAVAKGQKPTIALPIQPLPLSSQSSNLPPPTKTDSGVAMPRKQASLSSWFKPTPKSTA